jgi:protoporphyrinogen oxidase
VVAFVRPESVPALIEADGRAVFDAIRLDLDRAFPHLRGHVTRVRVYRWPEGSAVFYPGYLRRLGAFRGGEVEGDGPVALAGDYLVSPTIEGAVTAGMRAAERILSRLRLTARERI